MPYWLFHIASIITFGLMLTLAFYFVKIPVYYAYIIIAAALVAQAIDLDHFTGDTRQLFDGAKAVSNNELNQVYGYDLEKPFHNIMLYLVGSCIMFGLWFGWSLHLLLDYLMN